MDKTNQLLTVAEVADWLRVEPRYVYRLASSGELIRVYIGRYVRIPAVSVEAYIDAHTVEAVKPVRSRRPSPNLIDLDVGAGALICGDRGAKLTGSRLLLTTRWSAARWRRVVRRRGAGRGWGW